MSNEENIADTRIVKHWINADQMVLMQQIGAIPAPGFHGE